MKKKLTAYINTCLEPLLAKYGIEEKQNFDVQIPPDTSKGDFALNAAMKLAKPAKCPPRKLAEEICDLLGKDDFWFSKIEIAGPGFINLFVKKDAIESVFNDFKKSEDFELLSEKPKEKVIVDYSSVNIAKQMHVGHLRSTIIGDVLSRTIEARGDMVIRQNHLGDWGLPMAMVLWKAAPIIDKAENEGKTAEQVLDLPSLESLYKEATAECKSNPQAADECHKFLVDLQQGDANLIDKWKQITKISMKEVYRIYGLLDVKLKEENECGESFYREMLAETVDLIEKSGNLTESEGAKCVFMEEFKAKDGNPLPVIVVKSDGGFNYGTFDLAALRHRTHKLEADRIIYVTDARQALHFKQVFAVARKCDLLKSPDVSLEHVTFGTILGDDNKPLKTRSGENVKLSELLDEAIAKAYQVVQEKNPGLSEEKKKSVAQIVGIGAVKYADLSQNRNNDYVFSFDRMLALNGNTAPYLQYAHARICSIFRKGGLDPEQINHEVLISQEEEKNLIQKLMEFPLVVEAVSTDLRPHALCNFLFELATSFSSFYDKCPVLICEDEKLRNSRLSLCNVTRKALARALSLLGIAAPQEM